MIIYVLDPPSTMAYIYIYRYDVDMNVPRGDCGVFFFVSRKLIRDFTLILKTH